jgi:hypothetical protein
MHRLVLVWDVRGHAPTPWVAGRLAEPFVVADEVEASGAQNPTIDQATLAAGAEYLGPTDRQGGTFRLSKRGQGAIERTVSGGREIADADGGSQQAANARRTLESWQAVGMPVSRFYVNSLGHAWYEAEGGRRYLADVPGGYKWPD